MSDVGSVLWAITMAILSIITVVGNLAVLLSYYLDKNIRQPSNYFIFSLAVSDLLNDRLFILLKLIEYYKYPYDTQIYSLT
ncbi:hypothetical protein DICVIV_10493 [Dictyocaulus viviparus]|uniref:G-protein coupled receptors family 1 profile domain-containing protein n=1 Tax=Dictyocaulus viviparus TaxID=29172 RepID=A0A0D8XIC5_DICVI|nr:hypothetical protein DICVIV_10493 [Dictyocaulus viviparus]